jgi:hypothetical protein
MSLYDGVLIISALCAVPSKLIIGQGTVLGALFSWDKMRYQ